MEYDSAPEFEAQFLELTKKNKALDERFLRKISEILDNPTIGASKRHRLKHAHGTHMNLYVVVYRIREIWFKFYMSITTILSIRRLPRF